MERRRVVRLALLLICVVAGGALGMNGERREETAVYAAPAQTPVIRFSSYKFGDNGSSANIDANGEINIDENEDDVDGTPTDDPEIVVTVTLDTAPTQNLTVTYRSFDGTAVGGTGTAGDFTTIPNTSSLTFTPSQLTATFKIIVRNDLLFEAKPDEFFFVELVLPSGVIAGSPTQLKILIDDDDPAPTVTPGGATSTPTPSVFVDQYEPNDTLADSFTTAAGANGLCNATLWPSGDVDYFRFVGKKDARYRVFTNNLQAGLDTRLTVYNPDGNVIGQNDDGTATSRASEFTFTAPKDGFYFALVENLAPGDSTNRTYCFEIDELDRPTATPSNTPVPGADSCEFNSTIDHACEIGVGQTLSMSFVPTLGSHQDTDVFKLWMKPNITYTCETLNLAPVTDTNIIFLDQKGKDFQPNLGNDDKEPGDLGSRLSYRSTYTGWLHIMVGPVNPPAYEESFKHTYDITCTAEAGTPTPTPRPTQVPGSGGTGGGFFPTATPFEFPTPLPTPTPIDFSFLNTPTPEPPPVVVFEPLPTSTPIAGGQQLTSINVTVYYDGNGNFTPELNEGVMDMAVALYDNATGGLLAFGYTSESGMIRFDGIATFGAVRIVVPYLNYSQVAVGGNANILVRIAPQPLPIGIP